MTKEEKAKAYDEALKRAKNLENTTTEEDALIKYIFSEPVEDEDERLRKAALEGIEYLEHNLAWDAIGDTDILDVKEYLEKQKYASMAIEAVNRINEYINRHQANAHNMNDSNPGKKYYCGWDDALDKIEGILQDVYSGEMQKEQKKPVDLVAELKHYLETTPKEQLEKEWKALEPWGKIGPTVKEFLYGWSERKFKVGDKVHWHDDVMNVITITGFRNGAYLTDSAYGPIPFWDEDNWEKVEQKQECSEDERIRKGINILYADIDACITALLKARMDKDSESEGKALFKMEGLMVATLQVITCIEDYLEKQKEHGL